MEATEMRQRRDQVLQQISELEQNQLYPGQNDKQVAALQRQVTDLTRSISQYEKEPTPKAPPATPGVRPRVSNAPNPQDPYLVQYDSAGNVIGFQANPDYRGPLKPQVVTHGNHVVVVTPPTPEELAANPAAAPHGYVAYTDKDAQEIANRQTAVAESHAAVAAANQRLNETVQRSKLEIEQAVARGEDAASIRASRALDIQQAHSEAQTAIAQAQLAQSAANAYNEDRHRQAQESLTAQQIQSTKDQQAALDAVTQRGQDITAAMTPYQVQAQQANERLRAGQGYMSSTLDMLAKMNRDAPPGSDVVGRALPALLELGRTFFEGLGGLYTPPAPTLPARVGGPAGSNPPAGVTINVHTTPSLDNSLRAAGIQPDIDKPVLAAPAFVTEPAPQSSVLGSRGLGGEAAGGPGPNAPFTTDGSAPATPEDVMAAFGRTQAA